jgi:polysaccharide export outer membrane protein
MEESRSHNFYNNLFPIFLLTLLLSIISLTGCSSTVPVGKEVALERTSFSFNQNQHPYNLFPEYHIVPGDILDVLFQIRTWIKKEDFRIAIDHSIEVKFVYAHELDSTQRVRPDGNITLPYIGDIYVVGKTVGELTKELKDRYSRILNIPELYVEIPDFRSSIKELKADLHTAPRGLSRLVTVRPDGFVTFPMVGDVFVAGKTVPEVTKTLNQMYEKLLPDLHCDLFLEKYTGSAIYVVGQVAKPGVFGISRPITVIEALGLAGGKIPGAKLNSIFVIRRHDKTMVATRVDLEKTLAFAKDSKFFFLQPDDIVYVPQTWLSSAAEVARDLGNVTFFRGWGFGFDWQLHEAASGAFSF